jgi:hypothetical protein
VHHRVAGKVPVGALGAGGLMGGGGVVLALVVLFTGGMAAGASGAADASGAAHGKARAATTAHAPTVLTSGSSAYPEQTTVLSASSGGYVVEGLGRNPVGRLNLAPALFAATWQQTAMRRLPIPTAGTGMPSPSNISIAGPMVSALEPSLTRGGAPTVFLDDLSSGKTSEIKLPAGEHWQGAAPAGYLATTTSRDGSATTTTLLEISQSDKSVVTLGRTTGVDPTFLAGPDDVISTVWNSSTRAAMTIEFVRYSSPGSWQVLASKAGRWTCTSATGGSVGCFHETSNDEFVVDNYSLNGGALIERPVTAAAGRFRVLVTPHVTSWSSCGAKDGCVLTRLPNSSSTTTRTVLATGFLAVGAGQIIWGSPAGQASSSGIFSMTESSSSPAQLVPAPLSPISAAVVSVTRGSVSWTDNGVSGLGVWRRSVSGGPGGSLDVGSPTLVGTLGYAGPGSPTPAASIFDDGEAIAYSTDNPSGSTYPVGLSAYETPSGSSISITGQADGSESGLVGPQVSTSGLWVEWQRGTTCELYDLADRRASTPRLPGAVGCIVGDGHLAWVTASGEVEVLALTSKGLLPTRRAVEVVPPRSGAVVGAGARLFLGSGVVSWDYSWTPAKGSTTKAGFEAGYRNFTSKTAPAVILPAGLVTEGITTSDLALAKADGADPSIKELASGKVVRVAPFATSVSIGGDLVAWIGADGLPRVESLPG